MKSRDIASLIHLPAARNPGQVLLRKPQARSWFSPLWEQVLSALLHGQNLSENVTCAVFKKLFQGHLTEGQAKALLLLLARKGETEGEVTGCIRALKSLEKPANLGIPALMDTCGTGGDQSHSFNVSTLAAFVVAGAGGKVAKHGNRAISSRCGSSDLMEALGVRLEAPPKRMIESIRKYGIGYFHAPFYHPVFSRVQALRRKIGVRTIFNLLGPMINPMGISRQIVGVSRRDALEFYARILKKNGMREALVCHSRDGMDEISTAVPTDMIRLKNGKIYRETMIPSRLGYLGARKGNYRGGGVSRNRDLALRILSGKLKGPLRDIVIINAAAALTLSGKAKDMTAGITLAARSIESGTARKSMEGLKRLSRLT